jgi:hypothetical protein
VRPKTTSRPANAASGMEVEGDALGGHVQGDERVVQVPHSLLDPRHTHVEV